jgi:hypothetical protein
MVFTLDDRWPWLQRWPNSAKNPKIILPKTGYKKAHPQPKEKSDMPDITL